MIIEWGRSFGTRVNPASLHTNSCRSASQRQTSSCTGQELLSCCWCRNWALPTAQCCNCSADITTAAKNSRRMLLYRAPVKSVVHFITIHAKRHTYCKSIGADQRLLLSCDHWTYCCCWMRTARRRRRANDNDRFSLIPFFHLHSRFLFFLLLLRMLPTKLAINRHR